MSKHSNKVYKPSRFQQEIIDLDFDEFVDKTNIIEIIQEENQTDDNDLNEKLKYYYNARLNTTEWWKCGLKNLKFKLCDCVRKTTFRNVKLQCALVKQMEQSVQCDLKMEDKSTKM